MLVGTAPGAWTAPTGKLWKVPVIAESSVILPVHMCMYVKHI